MMKFIIVLCALIVVIAGDSSSSSSSSSSESHSHSKHKDGKGHGHKHHHHRQFKLEEAKRKAKLRNFNKDYDEDWEKYKKSYEHMFEKQEEEELRRVIWERAMQHINHHNQKFDNGRHKFKIGMNRFALLAHDEFVQQYNGFREPGIQGAVGPNAKSSQMSFNLTDSDAKTKNKTVDWRGEGIVTSVKNQGQCGGCWSFSANGALEGANALKTGKLVNLSEQNLIDCSEPQGNNGCNGGSMPYAFQYAIDKGGVQSNASYPYTGKQSSSCSFDKSKVAGTCKGYVNIPKGDEESLRLAVAAVGPVSVAIDASLEAFQLYQEGIFEEPKCSNSTLDHGVLVVGYGTENETDYWLVKNSWGEDWGIKGYIKMARNQNNQCGIANQAVYPVV